MRAMLKRWGRWIRAIFRLGAREQITVLAPAFKRGDSVTFTVNGRTMTSTVIGVSGCLITIEEPRTTP